MEKRQLGKSNIFVSKMGLGCMSLGTDEARAKDIVEAALSHGINYFDTADLYDFGENEKIVGKALQAVRNDVIVATKVGNRWAKDRSSWKWDPSKRYIKEAVKASLRRLNMDYIDLYQLHGGTIDDPIDETIEAFEELKSEGLIRSYGISSIRLNVIKEYVKKASIDTIMMQYSLLDRRPEEAFTLLRENEISVVARGPLAKGILSNTMLEKASDKVLTEGYLDYSYHELTHLFSSIQDKLGDFRSMTELSLQYTLSDPAVGAILPGASSIEQLIENVQALNAPQLTTEERQLLKDITKMSRYLQHRNGPYEI
ncbi:aldo/keto reductase [Bacillus spongiae]|uniref:Aldo/keto reductase n=1 Tax=Bacillus spongiae TaxID=2683610 RepID=A0ABU8HCP8_9BACI